MPKNDRKPFHFAVIVKKTARRDYMPAEFLHAFKIC